MAPHHHVLYTEGHYAYLDPLPDNHNGNCLPNAGEGLGSPSATHQPAEVVDGNSQ